MEIEIRSILHSGLIVGFACYPPEQNFSYNEVLRAIGQQPLDLPVPKRVGLKTYEDIFFSNLINDQSSYLGDVEKTGFSHEAPYEPPPRPEVYFEAR